MRVAPLITGVMRKKSIDSVGKVMPSATPEAIACCASVGGSWTGTPPSACMIRPVTLPPTRIFLP